MLVGIDESHFGVLWGEGTILWTFCGGDCEWNYFWMNWTEARFGRWGNLFWRKLWWEFWDGRLKTYFKHFFFVSRFYFFFYFDVFPLENVLVWNNTIRVFCIAKREKLGEKVGTHVFSYFKKIVAFRRKMNSVLQK